ncbi:MAG: hypothetical protein ACXW00_07620 [Methylobacter sp.]
MSAMMDFDADTLRHSPLFAKLSVLAEINPINTSNEADVERELLLSLLPLIEACDRESIQFQTKEDRDALFKLMFVAFQMITQIKPDSNTHH